MIARMLAAGTAVTLLLIASGCSKKESTASGTGGDKFLAENAKKDGVVVVPGIQYKVIKAGNGAQPSAHDCATVYYKGYFPDGKVFDQTQQGKPVTFPVRGVIGGWTEALQMMHVGDKWQVAIPSGLAYGRLGTGDGTIPPNQTLVFDIELLKVAPSMQGLCAPGE